MGVLENKEKEEEHSHENIMPNGVYIKKKQRIE